VRRGRSYERGEREREKERGSWERKGDEARKGINGGVMSTPEGRGEGRNFGTSSKICRKKFDFRPQKILPILDFATADGQKTIRGYKKAPGDGKISPRGD
jgi:hypothetical protein